jgi:hypothetical protein
MVSLGSGRFQRRKILGGTEDTAGQEKNQNHQKKKQFTHQTKTFPKG